MYTPMANRKNPLQQKELGGCQAQTSDRVSNVALPLPFEGENTWIGIRSRESIYTKFTAGGGCRFQGQPV
jgi:hypothetical protein